MSPLRRPWCPTPALLLLLLVPSLAACPPSTPSPQPATSGTGAVASVAAPGAAASDAPPLPPTDRCERTPHPFRVGLMVHEDLGLERYPPVLGFPIAFPKSGNLTSLRGFFASTIDEKPLVSQLETLSRWGDGPTACGAPIRWAYGFALANVPPKGRAYLVLEHRPDSEPRGAPQVSVDDDGETRVIVDTGLARFTVRRDWFNGLSKVELRGNDGTYSTVLAVPSSPDFGMLVEQGDKHASPINGKLLSFEVERRGPVVATIAVRGTYAVKAGPDLFRYTLRLHFYAGTASVQLDHTYYNGETVDLTAAGGKNRVHSSRVATRLPLSLGKLTELQVRGHEKIHRLDPSGPVFLRQRKRSPSQLDTSFQILTHNETVESGERADRPYLAASGDRGYAIATVGHLAPRDPQGLGFDPASQTLFLEWQSEPMFVGGARGIWSTAVLDFGAPGSVDLTVRGSQIEAHASRPLVAVPNVDYLNSTHAYGLLPMRFAPEHERFDRDVARFHTTTKSYLDEYRITGAQIWPDLPRAHCGMDDSCAALQQAYFEGGDCNYWDWSLVELEYFLRTGDPAFLHDFALGEATTMAETVSFRPNWWTKAVESSFGGFSPCYGGGREWGGPWNEGLNHRVGNCPGDYSYNKVHRLAYILTADRRFTDFFTDGAETAIRMYGERPRVRPDEWLELAASRQTFQYLEPLLTAAEFGRLGGNERNRRYRDIALTYFDFMNGHALEHGHACDLLGSGIADPKIKGECRSAQVWMLPIWIDWVSRLYFLYDHQPARKWLIDHATQSIMNATVFDPQTGRPDIGRLNASSKDNAANGWRTVYRCGVGASGIVDSTCRKVTNEENQNYFYANGLVAYLNTFGLILEVDSDDSLALCRWLPEAYGTALSAMDEAQSNRYLWGKAPGQAYAFTLRALGGMEAVCRGQSRP